MGFPIVDSVTPASGPSAGGTTIAIVGRNFTGATSVSFFGTPAASFSVIDDNTISAVTPAHAVGAFDVDVVNADGSSAGDVILNDDSGGANDGVYTNDPHPAFVSGLVAGGDGVRDNFSTGSTARIFATAIASGGFLDPNNAVSIELWYKTTAYNQLAITVKHSGGQAIVFGCIDNDAAVIGQVSLSATGSGGSGDAFRLQNEPSDGPAPVDGALHHLVITYDPSVPSMTAYVDGSSIGTDTPGTSGTAPTFTQTLESLEIEAGYSVAGGGTSCDITIDELAIYPNALSGGDVSANFAAASSSYDDYETQVLSLSPSAFYRFDDFRRSGSFSFKGASGWHVGRIGVG